MLTADGWNDLFCPTRSLFFAPSGVGWSGSLNLTKTGVFS